MHICMVVVKLNTVLHDVSPRGPPIIRLRNSRRIGVSHALLQETMDGHEQNDLKPKGVVLCRCLSDVMVIHNYTCIC